MKILIISLLVLTSCSSPSRKCELVGKWKSIEFHADIAVDINKDGVYNKNLLKEDASTEVKFHFMSNGKVERFSKNEKTNGEFNKSILQYVVEADEIIFIVSGMRQKHGFDITECKLNLYGTPGSGMTESGKRDFSIKSVFIKE